MSKKVAILGQNLLKSGDFWIESYWRQKWRFWDTKLAISKEYFLEALKVNKVPAQSARRGRRVSSFPGFPEEIMGSGDVCAQRGRET